MLVTRTSFGSIISQLKGFKELSLDSETTGLRPYHSSKLFSLIIGYSEKSAYYFNWWPSYEGFDHECVLSREHMDILQKELFSDPSKLWYVHNFNFDMHILNADRLELAGEIHCTLTLARVEYNEHFKYDLENCLERIDLKKDDRVAQWIEDNHAWEHESIPGKKQRKKNKFFYKVPPDIIIPYGLDDAKGCFSLGKYQERSILAQSAEYPEGVPTLLDAAKIEKRLAQTVFRMERVGVKIDRPYCLRAAQYEADRHEKAAQAFKRESGRDYLASSKLFEAIFSSERDKWAYTEKGNPSFESDALKNLAHPAAKAILDLRDSKSKMDFYHGFLYHADREDVIHANFKPGGTRTMRFSSAEPNLQNMKSEEEEAELAQEFVVRRAIIPRPGFIFIMPDYDQMEYKMMLDYAKHMAIQEFKASNRPWDEGYFEIANKVRDGYDVHQATADMIGFSRKFAKAINFGLLYGEGVDLLAANLGVTRDEAIRLKSRYFRALPYVQSMIEAIQGAIKHRGWVRNWAGYKYHFPDRNFAYTGPNTIIQGGCAAVNKVAMNLVDAHLLEMKSRMVLTIHDELPCEIHESEVSTAPKRIKELMESVYPHKYIPLTAGMEWSEKSLADKKKGFPA